MDEAPANSGLQHFLQTSRSRLEFRSALSAGGIAATIVCVLAMPLVLWRAHLGLHDGWLLITIVITAGAIYAILATRLRLAIDQVPGKLEVVVDERERVASAAEFYGDDDPFKRLAIRQTETWIDQEQERLSHMRLRKWPMVGAAAILALLLLWILTPGRTPPLQSEPPQLAVQSIAESFRSASSSSVLKHKNVDVNRVVQPIAPANGQSAAGALERKPPSANGLSPVQSSAGTNGGRGSEGKGQNGVAGTGAEGSKSSRAGEPQKMQNPGSSPGPSPLGDNRNAPAIDPKPTARLSGGQTRAVDAAQARSSGAVKQKEEIGKPDDVSPERAASSNDRVNSASVDTGELETLPPGRREIVIQYFREMRGQSAPAGADSQGDSHP